MSVIRMINRKGSKSCKAIMKKAGIPRYRGKKHGKVDLLVNYGCAGERLSAFYRGFPSARSIPTINSNIGVSKLRAGNLVSSIDGIEFPESKLSLTDKELKSGNFIEKRISSYGGIGICKARHGRPINGKYYQRFVDTRRTEVRVHAFEWIDKEGWKVQKRVGKPEEIAWNFNNGGKFITVKQPNNYEIYKRAKDISEQVLDMLGMSFGAIDFIVGKNNNLYFLEVNSAPGFKELTEDYYIEAFKKLKSFSLLRLIKFCS